MLLVKKDNTAEVADYGTKLVGRQYTSILLDIEDLLETKHWNGADHKRYWKHLKGALIKNNDEQKKEGERRTL